jgi:hypothetical protein
VSALVVADSAIWGDDGRLGNMILQKLTTSH